MIEEKVFKAFPNVRKGYFALKDVLSNQEYTVSDLTKIRPVAKRIQINNLITTILDSMERFTFSDLSNQDKQELGRCFSEDDIDINVIRNCIAHVHYTVDSKAENIQLKKGDFHYTITFEELNNIANKMMEFALVRMPGQELPFNGIKLNEFIDKIINQEEIVNANADMLASLIQSYNIYHAFLYEKVVQDKEQKRFVDYYKDKMAINLDLPYINQEKGQDLADIGFDTIKFEELTQKSRADLIYFLMTSEYKTETKEYFKKKNPDIIDEKEIIKKIYAMYLYPFPEYKNIAENIFDESESIDQYIINNISKQDYERYSDIIDFMIRKFPKSGRIKMGQIMPRNRDLLHGFEMTNNLEEEEDTFSFIYPPMESLIKRGTKEELYQQYIMTSCEIQDEFTALEITENKVITPTEFMFFVSNNLDIVEHYMEVPETIREFSKKIKESQNENPNMKPGQIYGNIMKDKKNKELKGEVANFYKNVPDDLKKKYIISKMKEYLKENKVELVYRNLLFCLSSFGIDERLLKIKENFDFNFNKMNIVDEEKISRMRELGKIFDFRDRSKEIHTDFTELLTHIRDSSIHAFTEVDFSKVPRKDFVVRKKTIDKDIPNDKIDLSGIRFNFQDYNPTTKETSFLLTNIPIEQVIKIIDLPSYKLISRGRSEINDSSGER